MQGFAAPRAKTRSAGAAVLQDERVTAEEPVFEFVDVVVERRGLRALDGLTAAIPGRGVTAVFGPSGSGKSTLLRLCNRLELPTSGRVSFYGSDIAGLDPLWLRRRVGMCFQRPTPFPGTVADNLRVADPDADEARMRETLDRVALTGAWLDRDVLALSGGEAQRVCLARTLMARPQVLLLDEPTSAVDAEAAEVIERAVRELAADGTPALWVTHDAAQVTRAADRVLRLERGRSLGLSQVGGGPDDGAGPR
ncbi:phosphate ABC transporter ATP-binding protein [Mycobacterium avium subsp. hominissuis]|uniref:ABC transporter ATP-binding protein n=1 Tax=Mycobacterium avium TaxID=1764 RepID=UPI0003925E3E|nr:phosphate ABC transporter ATP-binding protein [Mycobacterium avium]ETA95184.1 glycine/betaine ABC transporter [Mycobacterium avium 10-5581]ATO65046.3 phosphate ABC transporter ATP-binding protein [Mycobacterium avium subsp. hominissuis]ATO69605.2 phosphate ABC transporter ATP-binding protein [Mycobacterium avium subsp. hominissuis]ATO74133.2 phosphate ABC transporter ATP-binding protein [Mycobacterium avium subsp. hominissuis]BAN29667.1 ABC transporter ATP-binding protein [Mycobacterium avi